MNKPGYRQIASFLIVAGATGAVYFGLLFVCVTVARLNPYVCVSIAYVGALAFNFIFNKFTVFRKKETKSIWRELLGFLPLTAVNYAITLGIVAFLRQWTGETYSGSLAAGVVTTALTWFVLKKWIFRKKVIPTRSLHR